MDINITTKSKLKTKKETLIVNESYEANRIRMVLTKTCTLVFSGRAFLAAEIREKFEQGAAIPDLAEFYGVHVATIRGVVTNKHYNDGSLEVKSLVKHLSDELVIEARKRVASGEKLKDVARSMGFSQGAISSAVTGRTYGHLPGATNVYDYDYDLVVDLIKEGYPMTAVSEKLGISCKHVGNKFQEAMGMSIRQYRKLNKVNRGARL